MRLVKWNPTKEMPTLFDKVFDDDLFGIERYVDDLFSAYREPSVDIYEDENEITLQADIPGVEEKDIKLEVKDGLLTLEAERSEENEKKDKKFFRRELRYGGYNRAFTLPRYADYENIKAKLEKGILKVTIPKKEEAKTKKIEINRL
ncbi:MAG: Hsp20/alpha crystallin family protein [Nitrospinae bacterium]|nr:Hsp20/alpha crystallin family protein [Nitrospinota bacterium]